MQNNAERFRKNSFLFRWWSVMHYQILDQLNRTNVFSMELLKYDKDLFLIAPMSPQAGCNLPNVSYAFVMHVK